MSAGDSEFFSAASCSASDEKSQSAASRDWRRPSARRLDLSEAEFFFTTPAVDGTTDKDKKS
ncbi:hypothetical protein Ms3S1_36010 [Methylosinus sp. 3S-1]